VAATSTLDVPTSTAYAWFNDQAYHTLPETVNMLDNIALRNYLNDPT
jgi:hypothetical protein